MFDPLVIAGLVLLLGGLFGSRYLAERSLKLLSSEEKVKLLDSFARLRAFGGLPLLPFIAAFFAIGYLPSGWIWPAYFVLWALLGGYFFLVHRYVFRRMAELGINDEYQSAHRKARFVSYGGFFAFFVLNTLSPFVSR